jgi:predicted nucleic acid-binding protein
VKPEQVPPGPLLVDTDVVSLLALNEDRSDEFEALIRGHELFVCFVTVAEVETLLRLNVLDAGHQAALATALSGYSRFEVDIDTVVERWADLRAATRSTTSRNDRERRQNDTWLAACAMAVTDPPAIVTADLSDLLPIARAAGLTIVHPDVE